MPTLNPFDYAVLRVVPRVEREEFINAGVILQCRPLRFLDAKTSLDAACLASLAPAVDVEEVERYLRQIEAIARGDPAAGPIARLSSSQRFHWLTAPRSTIIQTSPVHSGLTTHPAGELARIFEEMVARPGES
jgi:hypothetical protein